MGLDFLIADLFPGLRITTSEIGGRPRLPYKMFA